MRVLLINQFYPPDPAATGQLLADLAEELANQRHDVHVICSRCMYAGGRIVESQSRTITDKSDRKDPYCSDNQVNPRIHRVGGTAFGHRHFAGQLLDQISFYVMAAHAAMRLPAVDVCVALTSPPFVGLIGAALKMLRKSPLILWTMDLYPQIAAALGLINSDGLLHRILARLSSILYRQASYVIAIGQIMTEHLIEAGSQPDKVVTIHNWTPGECVKPMRSGESPLRNEYGVGEKVAIMYSGNMGPGHELHTIVQALQRIRHKEMIRVIFSGDGKSRQNLQRSVRKHRLGFVAFFPQVPLKRLSDHLAAGDIHIVSQARGTEGLMVPSKLYGVMAAGRPTLFVGPACCEAAMIVKASNCGFVVEPGDIHGAVTALERLVSDAQLRQAMGDSAQAFYQANFGRDRSLARIVKLIKAIAAQATSHPEPCSQEQPQHEPLSRKGYRRALRHSARCQPDRPAACTSLESQQGP